MNIKIILLAVISILLSGCVNQSEKPTEKRSISVSIVPLKYFVDEISGGDFDVHIVVPPGTSPETYEPTSQQMKNLTKSETYFQLGVLDFELAMIDGVLNGIPTLNVVNLSDGIDVIEGSCGHNHGGKHASHGVDPHIWLSPKRVKIIVKSIYENMVKINPDSTQKYTDNFIDLIGSIDLVDSVNVKSYNDIRTKKFIIYHPALTYYANDYGLEQLSIEEDGKEPSAEHIKSLTNIATENKLKTIFYQKQLSSATVDALAREVGLKPQVIDPLEYNWLQNMELIRDLIVASSQK